MDRRNDRDRRGRRRLQYALQLAFLILTLTACKTRTNEQAEQVEVITTQVVAYREQHQDGTVVREPILLPVETRRTLEAQNRSTTETDTIQSIVSLAGGAFGVAVPGAGAVQALMGPGRDPMIPEGNGGLATSEAGLLGLMAAWGLRELGPKLLRRPPPPDRTPDAPHDRAWRKEDPDDGRRPERG